MTRYASLASIFTSWPCFSRRRTRWRAAMRILWAMAMAARLWLRRVRSPKETAVAG